MRGHEPTLDGVRGLAILLVFLYHVGIYGGLDGRVGLDRLLATAAGPLWLGVDLFFVLSGFLITGILYDAKGSPHYFRNFFGRRILRIFPLYYGFLTFAIVVFPYWLSHDAARSLTESQAWYWLFLSNVQVATYGWQAPLHLGHFWSLAVEEQFYLLWPLAVWTLDRKWLIRLAAACFVAALALRLLMPFGMTGVAAYVLLPTRMDSLASGALLALAMRGRSQTLVPSYWPIIALVTCSLALVAVHLPQESVQVWRPLARALRHTLIAIAGASLIALALTASRQSWFRRGLSAEPLVFLGKYSYGLYVIHVPIILFMADAGFQANMLPEWRDSLLPGLLLFTAITGGLSIMCAFLIYHAWEAPFLRLKRYLPYHTSQRTTRPQSRAIK